MNESIRLLKQSMTFWMSALKCTQPSQYCKQSYTVSITHRLSSTLNQCSSVFQPVLILLHLPSTCQPKRFPLKCPFAVQSPHDSIRVTLCNLNSTKRRVRAADRQLSSQPSIIQSHISLWMKYTWKHFTEHLRFSIRRRRCSEPSLSQRPANTCYNMRLWFWIQC